MNSLSKWLQQARSGGFFLWKLNFALSRAIPFNRPHKIKVIAVEEHLVKTLVPFKKTNHNHIGGTHACALAAAGEFASGLMLLSSLEASQYRIIMKSLRTEYFYQAKADVVAVCSLSAEDLEEKVIRPLMANEVAFPECISELHDDKGNHVATVTTLWQIKEWKNVRSR